MYETIDKMTVVIWLLRIQLASSTIYLFDYIPERIAGINLISQASLR